MVKKSPSRREVISSIGATGIYPTFGAVSAATGRSTEFSGIAYDTRTHEVLGESTGKIRVKDGKLRGRIKSNGRSVPIIADQKRQINKHEIEYRSVLSGKEAMGNTPLVARITVDERHGAMGGYFTYSSPKFGKLGFSLTSSSNSANTDLEKGLTLEKNSPLYNSVQTHRGIPTMSGIASVLQAKRGTRNND